MIRVTHRRSQEEQIDRLTSLLSTESLPSIQQRLEEQGMRKGFVCLFYGAPGTGKTETVLQIARQTGRDLMQVDIAGLRDKWVGEEREEHQGGVCPLSQTVSEQRGDAYSVLQRGRCHHQQAH